MAILAQLQAPSLAAAHLQPPPSRATTRLSTRDAAAPSGGRRASLLATTGFFLAALLEASAPTASHAFGTGFPGYDMNPAARQRAGDRIKAEAAEQRRLAQEYRAKKEAAAAAAAGTVSP